jgi:HPt (histidine-containing phosphotransfer) domain-containing protein
MAFEAEVEWILPEALQQLAIAGEQDIVVEVLTLFRSDTDSRVRTLRAAAESGDRKKVRAEAHSLKGSAIQVGANALGESCREMELTAETRPELLSLVAEIEARFETVAKAMSLEYGTVQ